MIRHHHERIDGSGYFEGLKGDVIFLEGSIVALGDVFDALVQQQPDAGQLDGYCVAKLEQVLAKTGINP